MHVRVTNHPSDSPSRLRMWPLRNPRPPHAPRRRRPPSPLHLHLWQRTPLLPRHHLRLQQQRPLPQPQLRGGGVVSLPADEASHDAPIEWWYFNGFVADDEGKEYAFHFVVFKGEPTGFGIPLLLRVTLGTTDGLEHYQEERCERHSTGV